MLSFFNAYREVPKSAYIAGLAHFLLEIHNNILPVMIPLLIIKLGLSYEQIGIMALIGTMASTLTQPLFGILSDRWDPRWVILLGILWIGFGTALVGFAPSYLLLLLFVGISRLGSAVYHPAGAALAREMAGMKSGTSMAVFAVNGNLGYAISPLIASVLLENWFGLKGTLAYTVTSILAATVLYLLFRNLKAPAETYATQTKKDRPNQQGSAVLLSLVVLVVMSRSWLHGSVNTFLPEYLASQGMSLIAASRFFALMLVAVGIGSLIGGPLADRVGQVRIVLISMITLIPASWLLINTTGWLQLVGLILTGLMIGGSFPVALVMAQEAWPQGPGLASALVLGLGWLPTGIGTWLVGRFADQTSLNTSLNTLLYAPLIGIASILIYMVIERNLKQKEA